LFPKAYDIVYLLKWQVFWLSPIDSSLPVTGMTVTVACNAVNMKGLQLRVQLRFLTGFP
jgi:hypothetical protein